MLILRIILVCAMLLASKSWAEATICTNTGKNGTSVPGAFYVGEYKGADNNNIVASTLIAKDFYCANRFIEERGYKKRFLTIFGSSSIKENSDATKYNSEANNKIYKQTYEFTKSWSKSHPEYPVLTGAGPGLMEAAARGAIDGSGISIGYTTYYKKAAEDADASIAYWKPVEGADIGKQIITDGLIFSSVSARETMMILHSAAAIFVPGGSGTNWEIFQMLEMLKSNQLTDIPVYMLGDSVHWAAYESYLNDMVARGTIKESERQNFIRFVRSPEELKTLLDNDKRLFPQ